MKSDFAILILSCDKYSDLWDPFFEQFWKYWPDCPYKIYLGSNETKYENNKIVNILSGKDTDWSSSYKKILNQMLEENIFVWMEDAFITSRVNTNLFTHCINLLKKDSTKHIHSRPNIKPDKIIDDNFGFYQKGMPYRVNVVGFWKKKYLEKILIDGENTWNFEIMGSYRASFDDGFFCVLNPILNYVHLVEKGGWIKEGFDFCKRNNIDIDFNKRTTTKFNLINVIKNKYFKIILNCPWSLRVKLMNLLRKLIVAY